MLGLAWVLVAFAATACAPRHDAATELSAAGAACPSQSSPNVAVVGEVARPGMYPLMGETTLRGALIAAGGLTRLAWQRRVEVARCDHVARFDLDAIADGRVADPALRPGDRVLVPNRTY